MTKDADRKQIAAYSLRWDTDDHVGYVYLKLDNNATPSFERLNAAEFASIAAVLKAGPCVIHVPTRSIASAPAPPGQ